MARPRGFDKEALLRPDDGDKKPRRRGRPPKEKKPAPAYKAAGSRGPRTTLEDGMIATLAQSRGRGLSIAACAARVRTTEDCLGQWLQRGKRDVAEEKETLYSALLLEWNAAQASYEEHLLELGDAAAQDKSLNIRWPTWRLGHLNRKEYTNQDGADGGLNGFALMTPEEAVQSVVAVMQEFLGRHKAGGGDAGA